MERNASVATPWEADFSVDGVVVQRQVFSTPGFDCLAGCTPSCPHPDTGADYGWHGDEHRLAVRCDSGVVTLVMFSDFLQGKRMMGTADRLQGALLTRCWSFPVTVEHVLHGPQRCDLQRAQVCYVEHVSSLGARQMTEAHVEELRKVPDACWMEVQGFLLNQVGLWVKLARFLLTARDEVIAANAALPRLCPSCDGSGVVPKKDAQ